MNAALLMFLAFVAATLVITYFSAKRSTGTSAYFAASRRITGWQNGLAVAGDYMSAASFLGIAGMIAFSGYDRSEEHTPELQSRQHLVCRLLLEKTISHV